MPLDFLHGCRAQMTINLNIFLGNNFIENILKIIKKQSYPKIVIPRHTMQCYFYRIFFKQNRGPRPNIMVADSRATRGGLLTRTG